MVVSIICKVWKMYSTSWLGFKYVKFNVTKEYEVSVGPASMYIELFQIAI